ncbi:GNAT family N-acetyltransferase [Actinotalea solisilvae]|uniref:GNAT family N-acetyltransferase n=1 Tax=Actinotalea solisilvae TaxID=2072922 RepID=UPI0027DCAA55|nr:GNAT family N-acetyltransferase [Actinotalea solisilvae]
MIADRPLGTDRLSLRRFLASDGPALHGILSRPAAVEFEPYDVVTHAQADDLARERASDPRFRAVETRGGTLVGTLYLAPSGPDWWRTWELGYVFHPDHWGRGYATEACRALLTAVFADGAHRVVARCDPANVRSWALLERLGLRREAHHVRAVAFVADSDGGPVWHDAYTYAALAEEWALSGTR